MLKDDNTDILFRKSIAHTIKVIPTNNRRVTKINISTLVSDFTMRIRTAQTISLKYALLSKLKC